MLVALNVKPASKLAHGDEEQERDRELILEKFEIEREVWSLCGARCLMCTDKMLPETLVANLDFTRPGLTGDERSHLNSLVPKFSSVFCEKWATSLSLIDLIESISAPLRISVDDAMALFDRAVWTRQIPIDIYNSLLHHEEPVTLVSTGIGEALWRTSLAFLVQPKK